MPCEQEFGFRILSVRLKRRPTDVRCCRFGDLTKVQVGVGTIGFDHEHYKPRCNEPDCPFHTSYCGNGLPDRSKRPDGGNIDPTSGRVQRDDWACDDKSNCDARRNL